jgi:hypothetical protein
MIFSCCNENRKSAVLKNAKLNGIDYLEVLDHDAIALNSPRQQTLLLHCLKAVPTGLTPDNILIQGGESITHITVQWVAPALTPPPLFTNAKEQTYFKSLPGAADVLVIRTGTAGDFSPYELRLVNSAAKAQQDPFEVTEVLAGFDLQLARVEFSFKVECGPDFDCGPQPPVCPPAALVPPPINYLAKDYGSFRTLMVDRLSQLLPGGAGTTEADLGVALAELIAGRSPYGSVSRNRPQPHLAPASRPFGGLPRSRRRKRPRLDAASGCRQSGRPDFPRPHPHAFLYFRARHASQPGCGFRQ